MNTQNQEGDVVLVTDTNYNEKDYLASNPDVAKAVRKGILFSGRRHFNLYGRKEGHTMRVTSSNTSSTSQGKIQKLYSWIASCKRAIFRLLYRIRNPQSFDSDLDPLTLETLETLKTQANDAEILLKQVVSILRWEANLPMPPPKHLQIRVVGKYDQYFIDAGMTFHPILNRLLRPVGKELKDFQSILDFGCGCGRGIRGLATLLPNHKLYGTDIDKEAIAWLKNNYSRFAEFSVAPYIPPTIYEDQMFDFIFGVSVMTHLPEDLQFQWLEELSRITKPGGYVILTTHGEKMYRPYYKDKEIKNIMDSKGFLHFQAGGFNYGKSILLPDFYQTTFHSHAYIQQEWKKYFDIIDIQAAGIDQGLDNHQDSVLLQKRT
jgi:SAM-dependent methyltransferase